MCSASHLSVPTDINLFMWSASRLSIPTDLDTGRRMNCLLGTCTVPLETKNRLPAMWGWAASPCRGHAHAEEGSLPTITSSSFSLEAETRAWSSPVGLLSQIHGCSSIVISDPRSPGTNWVRGRIIITVSKYTNTLSYANRNTDPVLPCPKFSYFDIQMA